MSVYIAGIKCVQDIVVVGGFSHFKISDHDVKKIGYYFQVGGQLLNGQTLLEFSHSSGSDPGTFVNQLRVKSAVLWVRVALNRSAATTSHHTIFGNKNMTLWVFKVKPSVANTSFLSGKREENFTWMINTSFNHKTSRNRNKSDQQLEKAKS
ncbi:hypothetical protein RUM44_000256 [Polyplax serrata]|uniref:Uncharacterized protein n=1 Tax=Polyplax serrata TaxID=468196 RepID=A0ABR1B5E4_POLSC